MSRRIETVVIAGGGTAGWVTAALLIKILGNAITVKLVESEQIGTVGVGEATIPPILSLNRALGLDETEFLRATKGAIKLGIELDGWKRPGERYMHAFGNIGKDFPFCTFHHFWRRGAKEGRQDSLWDYSLGYRAAMQNRFGKLDRVDAGNLPGLVYAYHFDASLYAGYLRRFAERLGVQRIEGLIDDVNLEAASGLIESLVLRGGARIAGDLFVDCSGFRGLLIGERLGARFEDWAHWLPCNRAVTVQSESVSPITPCTRATARDAGWQWRIPLQHRTGNGLVYCSDYLGDDAARELLVGGLDAPVIGEPRTLSFTTGMRPQPWQRNCVAIGLAAGFIEPLESTSIHMIQSAAIRLIKHFPHLGVSAAEIREYNRQTRIEWEYVRDFIVLHYHLNERDGVFWRECREMTIPDTLARRMALFRETGKVFREQDELFTEIAWQQVMIGQGLLPNDYHPLADALSKTELDELLDGIAKIVEDAAAALPTHDEFLSRVAAA